MIYHRAICTETTKAAFGLKCNELLLRAPPPLLVCHMIKTGWTAAGNVPRPATAICLPAIVIALDLDQKYTQNVMPLLPTYRPRRRLHARIRILCMLHGGRSSMGCPGPHYHDYGRLQRRSANIITKMARRLLPERELVKVHPRSIDGTTALVVPHTHTF